MARDLTELTRIIRRIEAKSRTRPPAGAPRSLEGLLDGAIEENERGRVLVVRRRLLAAADDGAAVLVSSHHLDEMARIAHRITVLHRGVVVGTLPPGGTDLERAFFAMVYAAEGVEPDGGAALGDALADRLADEEARA